MIENANPRQLMLFCGIAALITGTLASTSGCRCSEREVISEIGEFKSKEAGLKASIPKLAALVEQCPATPLFRVMWVGPGNYPNGGNGNRHALLYDREHKMIGYEDDFLSGISGDLYYADYSDIRAVGEKQGMLTDFTLYDRRPH